MTFTIHNWIDIEHLFNGTLLIGNGASVAVDSRFHYNSLKDEAVKKGFLPDELNNVFRFYDDTTDFEVVLKLLWQSSKINKILNIDDSVTYTSYHKVKDALIETVRDTHLSHQEICSRLGNLYSFTSRFEDIICLNYDLILYWIMMYGNSINDGHIFKDCFSDGKFQTNWRRFIKPIGNQKKCTLVFYPHGNLIFGSDDFEEFKIHSTGGLLDDIFHCWEKGNVPLFISEATSRKKVKTILKSEYLSVVYREILTDVSSNLVIYGWGMWQQDHHIIEQLSRSYIEKVAVSVFNNDQDYCSRIDRIIKGMNPDMDIIFYDSRSAGCWVNA
ncbi:DUF4917 family protein [Vibrio cholerae]|uniref:DUF4917 family protein n=1 Tax=Vibrio metoecus TaxID=1481663 RepID=UPI0029DA305C|nr:DUF4917 family protein [Vibrio cholerae]HEJ2462726.1 DUF4917 family protein [Vibrio cholerae]